MAVFNTRLYVIKTVAPVFSVHFSSTEPAGQTLPRSYRTLGQTPLGTGGAGKTHHSRN